MTPKCQDQCREASMHFKHTRTHTLLSARSYHWAPSRPVAAVKPHIKPSVSYGCGENVYTQHTSLHFWLSLYYLGHGDLFTFSDRLSSVFILNWIKDSTFGRQLRSGSFCQWKVGCELRVLVGPSNETTHCLMFGTRPHIYYINILPVKRFSTTPFMKIGAVFNTLKLENGCKEYK